MKFLRGLSFVTALSLEELAETIQLKDSLYDYENEYEWVIGECEGIDNIDICRTHLIPASETETSVIRYAHEMDSVIPKHVLRLIAERLKAADIGNIKVGGFDEWGVFLIASSKDEIGV